MPPLKKTAEVIKEEVVTELSENRRSKQRFAIDLPLTYKFVKNYLVTSTGTGQTLDISSSGIAFTTNETINIGTHLELSISWPVGLNANCRLKLVIEGRVVRSDGGSAALRMDRHEFRTQGRAAIQPEPALTMAVGQGW
jgi:hypothetical protein